MHISNQPSGFQQKAIFAPVAGNFTNAGATVTYSIQHQADINAYQQQGAFSGHLQGQAPTSYTPWHTQGGFGGYALQHQYQPYVQAGQFGQYGGGTFQPFQSVYGGSTFQPLQSVYSQGQLWGQHMSGLMLQPSVDISETTSDVVVTAYVPNTISLNDLSLNATDNSVSIAASGWNGSQSLVIHRTVALPTSIRAEAVDASLQSGVLEIRLPKAEKQVRRRNTISQDERQTK